MPLPTTLDAAATGARQAYPQAAARKPQADFGAAFERAEKSVREPAADDRPARNEPTIDLDKPAAEQPADDACPAPQPEAKAEAQPQTEAEAQAALQAQVDAAKVQAEADAEAAKLAADAAQAAEALTADATLALMIATGGTAAAPATPIAADAQAATLAAVATAAVEGTGTNPLAAAITAAQTEAKADAETTPAPAATTAPATPAAATPGSLAETARALNLTGMQTTTAPAATDVPANMTLALAAQAEDAPVELPVMAPGAGGAVTPTSDEATSLPLPVLTAEDGDATVEAADAEAPTVAPTGVNDRPLAETARGGHVAAPAKAEAPVRPDDVMPQLLKHADMMKAQQANSIKLQLYPEHLGKMEIKVSSHQGVLTASISADSQNVKAMMETQVVNLQRSLQELGLKIDKVEVTLASSNLGGFNMAGQQQQFGQQQQQQTQQQPRFNQAMGYEAWLPDAAADDAEYAPADAQVIVNYVA